MFLFFILLVTACEPLLTPPAPVDVIPPYDSNPAQELPEPQLSILTSTSELPVDLVAPATASPTKQAPTATAEQITLTPENTLSAITETRPAPSLPASLTCEEPNGQVVEDQFNSAVLSDSLPFRVYLPPCYDGASQQRYPVMYLLHGISADESQWTDIGLEVVADQLIVSGTSAPFIAVMPKVPNLSVYPSEINTQVIAEGLVPFVDGKYPTLNDRGHRTIGGISRGASWALRIGLTRPDLFSKIGMHSLALEYDEIKSWVNVMLNLTKQDRPELFVDTGNGDADQISAKSMTYELNTWGLPHTFHLFTGAHNQTYWAQNLSVYLEWYARGWQEQD